MSYRRVRNGIWIGCAGDIASSFHREISNWALKRSAGAPAPVSSRAANPVRRKQTKPETETVVNQQVMDFV
jgi:hypothetical protein